MAYQYFPGCSLRATGAAYEHSMLELFRVLGIGLDELDDWNCCGATSYMAIDEGSAFVLSARNLSLARQRNTDLLAPCSACYLVLRKAQDYAQHYPETGARIREALQDAGLPQLDGVRVRHPLEVLYNDVGIEKIKSLVKRKWTGGRLACYYGCQVVRPYDEVDRAHNPTRMDELMQAAGIPTVEYSLKTKCCGGSLTGTIHEVGVRLNYVLLKEAVRKGAECIVTICPLCQFNLDSCQAEIRKQTKEPINIPILYFTQVLGWALGGDPAKLGFKRSIAGRDLIKRWFASHEEVEAYV
jgi:heterodisulfide reductase subunit B2